MSIWFKEYTLEDLNEARGLRKDHINRHLDIRFTEIGEDYLKATMPVDGRTVQPFGILHGGASCVLAETLGSVAAWMCVDPDKQRGVGIEINANHLRPVSEGLVTGICKPVQTGRSIHVWQIDIFNDAGKMNCTSRLTLAIKDI
ncbi:MAG: hotdog fold thioesterase [Rhodospirillales bacterium]|nr:hotdog fold thioesterase [Alphaproteobacteria bacterium]USO03626.1 MAG: hotdog fold thioesterase [Rhodospirillales bacterium]